MKDELDSVSPYSQEYTNLNGILKKYMENPQIISQQKQIHRTISECQSSMNSLHLLPNGPIKETKETTPSHSVRPSEETQKIDIDNVEIQNDQIYVVDDLEHELVP